jgi:hypothetical protein
MIKGKYFSPSSLLELSGCICPSWVRYLSNNNQLFNIFRGGRLYKLNSSTIEFESANSLYKSNNTYKPNSSTIGFDSANSLYNPDSSSIGIESLQYSSSSSSNLSDGGSVGFSNLSDRESVSFEKPQFHESLRDNFVIFIKMCASSGLTLNLSSNSNPIKIIEWYDELKYNDKPRARTKMVFNNQFDNELNISLSIVNNNYIIAHYNAADLPMLSDFEVLKQQLSIVNKSFVSLGKPLRYLNTNVYVRDTILLAPAMMGSLKALGKLYSNEGDFSKKLISKDDLNNMGAFLKKDKKAFEDYALQDAVITLKHAIAMESFNMSVQMLGIPLTLSSLGRNYVFKE